MPSPYPASPPSYVHTLVPRAEVNKCSIMHWFRIDKAVRELGFRPVSIPFEETVDWFRARGYGASATSALAGRRGGRLDSLLKGVALAAIVLLCLAFILLVLPVPAS